MESSASMTGSRQWDQGLRFVVKIRGREKPIGRKGFKRLPFLFGLVRLSRSLESRAKWQLSGLRRHCSVKLQGVGIARGIVYTQIAINRCRRRQRLPVMHVAGALNSVDLVSLTK